MSDNDVSVIVAELRRQTKIGMWMNLGVMLGLVLAVLASRHIRDSRRAQTIKALPTWEAVCDAKDQGDYPRALELATRRIEGAPNYAYGYAMRGSIYVILRQLQKAEADLAQAYDLWPSEDNQKDLDTIHRLMDRQPK